MTEAAIALTLTLIEQLIKDEPAIAAGIQSILTKTNPTPADAQALNTAVQAETFAQLAPDAKTS